MPQTIRTPFNQGGTIVADPYDQIEESNRNAAMRAAELTRAGQGDDLRSQIALQQLANQRYEFGQGRADSIATHREDRAAAADAAKQQFDYLREGRTADSADRNAMLDYTRGRDTSADAWRNKVYEEGAPGRVQTAALVPLQTELLSSQLAEQKAKMARMALASSSAAPLTNETPEETQLENAAIASGSSPAEARLGVQGQRKEQAKSKAAAISENLKRDATRFSEKDHGVFGYDPSDTEMLNIRKEVLDLAAAYKAAGDDDQTALMKAKGDLEGSSKEGLVFSRVTDLYKSLGMR